VCGQTDNTFSEETKTNPIRLRNITNKAYRHSLAIYFISRTHFLYEDPSFKEFYKSFCKIGLAVHRQRYWLNLIDRCQLKSRHTKFNRNPLSDSGDGLYRQLDITRLYRCNSVTVSIGDAHLNYIQEFSPYRKENTTLHHYKYQLVNAVYGNNSCLIWRSHETHKYILREKSKVSDCRSRRYIYLCYSKHRAWKSWEKHPVS
jgi:hypothetical protein